VRLSLDDLFLFFQLFGRHFVRLANAWSYSSNVHGDVTGQLFSARGQSNNGRNLVVAVNVATHNRRFYLNDATYGNVLANLLNQRFTLAFQFASHQCGNVCFRSEEHTSELQSRENLV